MDAKLLDKYLEYARSEEACAVLFVRMHVPQADGHWVDVVDCRTYEKSPDPLHFRFVLGGLYKKRLKPQYPSKSDYTGEGGFREQDYYLAMRAITWDTAQRDIEQQKSRRVKAIEFKITGVSYDKNRDCKGRFRDGTPAKFMDLAANPNDRTDPRWAQAVHYLLGPEFVYKIKQVDITEPDA
ncbi:MAG: hypothetical protein U0935_22595 [Pirellulales bacterium]